MRRLKDKESRRDAERERGGGGEPLQFTSRREFVHGGHRLLEGPLAEPRQRKLVSPQEIYLSRDVSIRSRRRNEQGSVPG